MKKLKNIFLSFIVLFCFIVTILSYQTSKDIIISTSILWFDKIVPSIPISYFFGTLLINFDLFFYYLYRLINKITNFENYKSFTLFILSMIVGCPTNIHLIVKAYEENNISKYEATRLLKITSFMSLFFIILVFPFKYSIPLLIGQYLSSFIFSYILKTNKEENTSIINNFDILSIISDLPQILLNILSSMIIISIIKFPILKVFKNSNYICTTILSYFEITTGINSLVSLYDNYLLIFFSSILLSFNGLAILLQAYQICKKKRLDYLNYIKYRFIHSILATIISLLAYYLLNFFLSAAATH